MPTASVLVSSRDLVSFYDKTFEADGLLLSLYETAENAGEQARRREGGHRPRRYRAIPGDASQFVSDTIPHGSLMRPGEVFTKTWTIRNSGRVPEPGAAGSANRARADPVAAAIL